MKKFWGSRRVLVTGQTGFKGSWLCLWLGQLGANVSAFALSPNTEPSLYKLLSPWEGQSHSVVDLHDLDAVSRVVCDAAPEIVFHLAAQSLVRPSYNDPVNTYVTNVIGTLNLLMAVRDTPSVKAVVIATTDKVYENDSSGRAFREEDRLGGKDPYSASKACAELLTQSFRESFLSSENSPAVATVRAGNVIGGGDWSEDRLVPDIIRAMSRGEAVMLRYPDAVRPWQHVLEPLHGYLSLAEQLISDSQRAPRSVNFGPDPGSWLTVAQVADILAAALGSKGSWQKSPDKAPPEAGMLTLSSDLAKRSLQWRPRLSMPKTIEWTANWYRAHMEHRNMRKETLGQIAHYEALCSEMPLV